MEEGHHSICGGWNAGGCGACGTGGGGAEKAGWLDAGCETGGAAGWSEAVGAARCETDGGTVCWDEGGGDGGRTGGG